MTLFHTRCINRSLMFPVTLFHRVFFIQAGLIYLYLGLDTYIQSSLGLCVIWE